MTYMTKEQTYAVLRILIQLAPDAKAQAVLSRGYDTAAENNIDALFVAATLADGVLYGNWPWA